MLCPVNMLSLLTFLVGQTEARELSNKPYYVPSSEEAFGICAASTQSCDTSEVRKQCDQERAAFREKLLSAPSDVLVAKALASWQCSTVLLDATSCTLDLSAKLSADRDGNRELSFHEFVEEDVTAASGIFGYEEDFKEPYLLELRADFMANYIPRLTKSTFCPMDLNHDGVVSAKDDVDNNGIIDNQDRKRYRTRREIALLK